MAKIPSFQNQDISQVGAGGELSAAQESWVYLNAGINGAVTNGSLTRNNSAEIRSFVHKFSWTNADVVALGDNTSGDITLCTLPAKTVVRRAWIVITGQAANVTSMTVSLGRVGTAYTDYIVASNAKAAANTIYGDADAEIGSGLALKAGDFPSYTGTTAVIAQFVTTVDNLSAATGSSGVIYLETITLP